MCGGVDALVAVRLRKYVEHAARIADIAGGDILAAHDRAIQLPTIMRHDALAAARALRCGQRASRVEDAIASRVVAAEQIIKSSVFITLLRLVGSSASVGVGVGASQSQCRSGRGGHTGCTIK